VRPTDGAAPSVASDTWRRRAMFLLVVSVQVVLLVAQLMSGRPIPDVLLGAIGFMVYTPIGGLIIFRRGGHPTGWLLLLVGMAVLFADGFEYLPAVSPFLADWVASWAWGLVFAVFALLTLTFPSGRLSRRPGGPRLAWMAAWALPVLVAISALTETLGGPETAGSTSNTMGFLPAWLNYPALLGVVAIFLGAAVSLVMKRRKTTGAERAQLTWVVFALVLLVVTVCLTFVYVFGSIALGRGDSGDSAWSPAFLVMLFFPVSFGIAVLRYRLYEIDRIVSRTVTYLLVVGSLGMVFFGAVTLITSFLPAESDLAVAASTLAVAALFNPVRGRVQVWIDRHFNRARYDAQLVVDAFADSLRDRVDATQLLDGWRDVVADTMQPETIGVWVRPSQVPG